MSFAIVGGQLQCLSLTHQRAATCRRRSTRTLLRAAATSAAPQAKAPVATASSAVPASTDSQRVNQVVDGKYSDYRWTNGSWDLESSAFKGKDGKVDWDLVIDAEMARRKLLEDSPIPSTNEDPVFFDTAQIPWWAWVKRFHLPEAEKANGRAAMVGYFLAYFVDSWTGAGLYDQQNSFLGKLALHLVVFAILIFRSSDSLASLKNLLDEATFYDKQWQANWLNTERPKEED
ncbi:g6573 [Coccomyxa elongata]